jgi:acylphosphatase
MSDGSRRCLRYRVTGRVQGVFYRASTEAQARQLHLTGWVRNCENGDVELVACGAADRLTQLERWLWQGPPSAQVSTVQRQELPWQDWNGFVVRR